MIVSCPNCSTNFKVPEAALGRAMKCARCAHVWREGAPVLAAAPAPRPAPVPAEAMPFEAEPQPDFAPAASSYSSFDDEIPLESPGADARPPVHDPVFEAMMAEDPSLAEIDHQGFAGEGSDPFQDEDEGDPFAKMSELMSGRQPESMPDVFSSPRPKKPLPRRKGAFVLWVVGLLVILAALALGLYFFQDRLIDHWPGLSKYYEQVGLRRDEVGAGLSFRNYNSERLVQDNNEVLIVRGVIANGTEQKHDIPLLRLALYNGTALLQEKIISPPQATLDGKATVGFKVTLDQPDVNATRFEVTFIAPK